MLILEPTIVHQIYYKMTATDKWSLISESVAMTQIDILPVEEEPDQHVICTNTGISRTTTIRKSLLSQNQVSALGMKS
jgi:hypothetical protein